MRLVFAFIAGCAFAGALVSWALAPAPRVGCTELELGPVHVDAPPAAAPLPDGWYAL